MASGAIADFARLPPQRKVLVFVLIGALLGVLYWKLVYKPLDEDLEAAEAERDRIAGDIPVYDELRARMTRLKELIDTNQTALPSAPELPAFLDTLQRKITESGAEPRKWSTRPQQPVEGFVKAPVEVEITGTFMQIKRFFASLVQRDIRPGPGEDRASAGPERIVSIENLALINPEVKNREIILTARFIAVAFRQEDRPAGAQPAGGQPAGARPGAPAAPVIPPPPLPSTAPPAGARAPIESTPEKGDAQDRKAAGAAGAAPGAPPAGTRPAAGSDRLKGGL